MIALKLQAVSYNEYCCLVMVPLSVLYGLLSNFYCKKIFVHLMCNLSTCTTCALCVCVCVGYYYCCYECLPVIYSCPLCVVSCGHVTISVLSLLPLL